MKTDDFDYYLPEELIAQVPLEHREESKLLVLDKDTGEIIDDKFYDIINLRYYLWICIKNLLMNLANIHT